MREVELKAVVDDLAKRRKKIEQAGANLIFEGKLLDRRYDVASQELSSRDEVLRIRRYADARSVRTYLDWKGATELQDVYKTREEISTAVDDFESLHELLSRLGFITTMEIDREIAQYSFTGATIRFERYPRMDILVEVEGDPEAIERAIEALGMARGEFTSERLSTFVERFEQRTGVRAAICETEMSGDYRFRQQEA
jgi:predicted adenylyl cyclase CyaB